MHENTNIEIEDLQQYFDLQADVADLANSVENEIFLQSF